METNHLKSKNGLPKTWILQSSFIIDRDEIFWAIDPLMGLVDASLGFTDALIQYQLEEAVLIPAGARVSTYVSLTGVRARLVVDRGGLADIHYALRRYDNSPISTIPPAV